MKTIVLLLPGFPGDESDSTCLPAPQAFVRAVNRNFPALSVVIVALQYPPRKGTYSWNGNEVMAFDGKKYRSIFRPLLWLAVFRSLAKLKSKKKLIGLLSFWCTDGALIGKLFSYSHRLPHFCWLQGQDAKSENKMVRLINLKSSCLISISEFLSDQFELHHGIRPKHVIHNGVDPSEFPLDLPEGRPIDILGVGSLIPLKRFRYFIEAIGLLAKEMPLLKAVICGDGPEREQLQKQINENGLNATVRLTGELSHHEVLALMAQSRVFLHPSSFEGYSSACLEALYSGCHVVSFIFPEKKAIAHWHVVESFDELIQACKTILIKQFDFTKVLVHTMDASARSVISLFDYKEDNR